MHSEKHEIEQEKLKYVNLKGYSIISVNKNGDVGLKNAAGNTYFSSISKLEKEAGELGSDKKPFHENKFSQRKEIITESKNLLKLLKK